METESRRAFNAAMPAAWVVRDVAPDYGVDMAVEIFDGTTTSGRTFNVQLKATDEADVARALKRGVRFNLETIEYYKSLPAPMLMVLYHGPTGGLFCQWLHAYDAAARTGRSSDSEAKSVGIRFLASDEWTGDVDGLDAAVRGFIAFRSPTLRLPIPVVVHADSSVTDGLPVTFALREALAPVADLVAVEHRTTVAADEPAVLLRKDVSCITLAGVASVTFPRDGGGPRPPSIGADLALGIALALTNVGQTNIAAQITAAVARASTLVGDLSIAVPLAAAMAHARRVREAIELADALDASEDADIRLAASTFLHMTRMLAPMSDAERSLALDVTERRLERRLERGERAFAGAEAYNMGMLHKGAHDGDAAIAAFERARELEPRYEERAYFQRDLAGALFELGRYQEAAVGYGRAIDLGDSGLVEALHADALLFAGRYADSEAQLDKYLEVDRGGEDAEWRLKRSTIPHVRRFGGDVQTRDPERADGLAESVDLQDPSLTIERATALTLEALDADACCGEAWFRYVFVEPANRGLVELPPAPALAAAVLLRYATGAWVNAAMTADIADAGTLRDIFQAAYRFERDDFVKAIVEASSVEPGSEEWNRRLGLLEEAVAGQDTLDRRLGFTMRFNDDEGGSDEVVCDGA